MNKWITYLYTLTALPVGKSTNQMELVQSMTLPFFQGTTDFYKAIEFAEKEGLAQTQENRYHILMLLAVPIHMIHKSNTGPV